MTATRYAVLPIAGLMLRAILERHRMRLAIIR